MTTWKELTRRFVAPLLAVAMIVSVGVYEFAKPASAAAMAPAPAAPAGGQAAPSANNCPRCGFKAPPGPVGKRYCMVCDKSF